MDLALYWFAGEHSEDKIAGVLLLAEHLAPRLTLDDVPTLARPLADGHVGDWNVCDWYSTKSLHAFVTAQPAEVEARCRAVAAWCHSGGLWQRRAGVVALVKLAPRGDAVFPGFSSLIFDACTANIVVGSEVEPHRFAHTGPGWVLRELSVAAPEEVAAYVAAHPELSVEARRMATARLGSGPYRRR